MTVPVFVAFRLGRMWWVATPATDTRPARLRMGTSFASAARAAGLS